MHLTRTVGYALGALLRLAQLGGDSPATAARLRQGCKFPPRYLYRVLNRLVDASLVEGQSGPTVGYVLARPADEIRLLDVVQAIEGDREFDPLLPVHPRQRTAVRRLNALARRQHNAQRALLKRLTLAQLLEG